MHILLKEKNYTNIDLISDWNIKENSSLVHYCKNETIQGIRITEEPKFSPYSFVDYVFMFNFLRISMSQNMTLFTLVPKRISVLQG